MPITAADIKLLASARMTDADDAGGQMTGVALQDGAENNVFPDLSTLNRALGALQLRKVYAAVLSLGTDTLLGAHVILDDLPDDAAVSAVLMPSTGQADTLAALAVRLNASGEAFAFRGAAVTTALVASDAVQVPVAAVRAPLIPRTTLTEASAGGLEAVGAQASVVGLEPTGQTVALTISGFNLVGPSNFFANVRPGSVAGTFTAPGGAGTASSTTEGVLTLTAPGYSRTLAFSGSANFNSPSNLSLDGLTSLAITAEALVPVSLPQQTLTFPVVDGQLVYSLALPAGTSLGSEQVVFDLSIPILLIPGTSVFVEKGSATADASGRQTMVTSTPGAVNYAYINRATGVLQLVLSSPAKSGTVITVTFAEGGNTAPVAPGSLVSAGLFSGGDAVVTLTSGFELAGAAFSVAGGEAGLRLLGGIVRTGTGTVRGSASAAGTITLPGNDGRTISGWYGVQRNTNYGVLRVSATLPTNLIGSTLQITGTTVAGTAFTATANVAGVFSTAHVTGTYIAATGALQLVFASSTKLRTLAYSATRQSPQSVFADMRGIDPSVFAADGTVPILAAGHVVVLRNSATVAAATYANTNVVNLGRTNLADVRVVGANGLGIAGGWSVNLATGLLAVNDISGWVQPVTIRHAIEHVAVALSVPNSGTVVLSRAPTRDFAAGSLLSSALVLDDLQALAGAVFAQESWTSVWADARIGAAIAPQYQQAANPITVINAGAITERWAFIFLTSTTYRLVGETLGVVSTGDINTDFSPINPATGQPYFTIQAEGWGAWSAGNVLRLNTYGANAPVWVARAVLPSAPSSTPDSLTLAVRGDIDA